MNICPICDSRIEGKWCRRCFRFVTPLEIPENLHLNEGHDLKYETDCEYHDSADLSRRQNVEADETDWSQKPDSRYKQQIVKADEKDWSQKPDSKYKQQIEERRRQMEARRGNADFSPVRIKPNAAVLSSVRTPQSAAAMSGRTAPNVAAVPKQQAEAAKKKKKRGIPIVELVMLAIFIGYVYFSMSNSAMNNSAASSNARKNIPQAKSDGWENADSQERESTTFEGSGTAAVKYLPAAAALRGMEDEIKPVDSYIVEGQDGGTVYVYDCEELQGLDLICDIPHFDKTCQDIFDLINSGNTVYYIDGIPEYPYTDYCALIDTGTLIYTNFSEYYSIKGSDVSIILIADAVTKQLHSIDVISSDLDAIGFQVAAYELLNELMPAYYQGLGAMTEDFKKSVEDGIQLKAAWKEYSFTFDGSIQGVNRLTIVPATEN